MYLADIWMQNKITILTLHKVDKTPGEILAIVDELRFGIEINDLLYISNVISFAEQCHYVLSWWIFHPKKRGKCDFVTLLQSPKSNENTCQWCTFATAPSSPGAGLSNQALSQQRCERKRTSSSLSRWKNLEHITHIFFSGIHVG